MGDNNILTIMKGKEMGKTIKDSNSFQVPLLFVLFGCLVVYFTGCTWGIESPIGSYGKVSKTVAGSTDMTMQSSGTDVMNVNVGVNPALDAVDVGAGLNITGVKSFVNKGTFYKSDIIGRANSVNTTLLGEYSTGDNGTGSREFAIEFYQVQGGSELHDLVRETGLPQERATVPVLLPENRESATPASD